MLSHLLLKIALLCSLVFIGQMEKSNPLASVYCEGDSIPFNPALSGGKFFIDVYNPATNGSASGIWWPHDYAIAGDTWFKAGYEVTLSYQHNNTVLYDCGTLIDTSYIFNILPDSCCATPVCCLDAFSNTYLDLPAFDSIPSIPTTYNWSYSDNPWNVSSGPLRINGTIFIHPNIDLLIDSMQFEFGPKGRIVVVQKGKLTLNNTLLTGDPICETMWHGIRVLGPGYGTISTVNNAGQLVANNNTKIEHAVVGVANTDLFPANFILEDIANTVTTGIDPTPVPSSLFPNTYDINNEQAARLNFVSPGTTFQSGGLMTIDSSFIIDCFYGGLAFLVDTNNIDSIVFSYTNFETQATNLRYPFENYTQTEVGFYTNQGYKMGIRHSYFNNLQKGVYSLGSERQLYKNNSFENCRIGLRFYNWDAAYPTFLKEHNYVQNNQFDNCAIVLQANETALKISGNDINVSASDTLAYVSSIGMSLKSCIFDISDINRIKSSVFGLVLEDCRYRIAPDNWLLQLRDITSVQDSTNSIIYNNYIRHSQSAILAINKNGKVQIRCNQFSLYDEAGIYLYADSPATQVLNDQGVCGSQGPLPGNLFGVTPNGNSNDFPQGIYLHDGNVKNFFYNIKDPNKGTSPSGNTYYNNITCNQINILFDCNSFSSSYCGQNTIISF